MAAAHGSLLPLLHRGPVLGEQAELVRAAASDVYRHHIGAAGRRLLRGADAGGMGGAPRGPEPGAGGDGGQGRAPDCCGGVLEAADADHAARGICPPRRQHLYAVHVRHPAREGVGMDPDLRHLHCRGVLRQRPLGALLAPGALDWVLWGRVWAVWCAGSLHPWHVATAGGPPAQDAAAVTGRVVPLHHALLLLSGRRHGRAPRGLYRRQRLRLGLLLPPLARGGLLEPLRQVHCLWDDWRHLGLCRNLHVAQCRAGLRALRGSVGFHLLLQASGFRLQTSGASVQSWSVPHGPAACVSSLAPPP
mmetsp:Transcript_50447/g.120866  ORF Transcript_50447/g.120866 Transcript_50447/m.120866 type:complete len:305 (-) Transcript_50447:627-1541(-)